jgi:hypothetical protein
MLFLCVRAEGLEPPCLTAPDPKSGTSTNFATPGKKWSAKIGVFAWMNTEKWIKFCEAGSVNL